MILPRSNPAFSLFQPTGADVSEKKSVYQMRMDSSHYGAFPHRYEVAGKSVDSMRID
jgi:hypothetical protein